MKFSKKLGLMAGILAMFVAGASELSATDYVIFVHGRSSNHCGTSTTDVNNYWGNAKNITTSLTKYFVGYDGATDPRTWGSCRAQTNLYSVLQARCTGANRCKIICHSAGCYATEYFLDKSGSGYNIDFVYASSSAAGGSEAANLAFWESNSMVDSLKTGNARGSYNHNNMRGVTFYALAGYKGTFGASAILPGEDDGAVAFHSTCGASSTGSWSVCNMAKYTSHVVLAGSSAASYSSSKQGYYRTHVGDGSDSINDATKIEWNRCKTNNWGCK